MFIFISTGTGKWSLILHLVTFWWNTLASSETCRSSVRLSEVFVTLQGSVITCTRPILPFQISSHFTSRGVFFPLRPTFTLPISIMFLFSDYESSRLHTYNLAILDRNNYVQARLGKLRESACTSEHYKQIYCFSFSNLGSTRTPWCYVFWFYPHSSYCLISFWILSVFTVDPILYITKSPLPPVWVCSLALACSLSRKSHSVAFTSRVGYSHFIHKLLIYCQEWELFCDCKEVDLWLRWKNIDKHFISTFSPIHYVYSVTFTPRVYLAPDASLRYSSGIFTWHLLQVWKVYLSIPQWYGHCLHH